MSRSTMPLIDSIIWLIFVVGVPLLTLAIAKRTFWKKKYSVEDVMFFMAVVAFDLWIILAFVYRRV
jgi:hypothetical protein